jgi:cell division protein ZapE
MTMLPSLHYHRLIEQRYIERDEQQLKVLPRLDALYEQLCAQERVSAKITRKIRQLFGCGRPPKGVYVWGGVGTGKSFLIDNFFNVLPLPDKLRMHFHNFMDSVHFELTEYQGTADPLTQVAKDFARRTRILCLDELMVNDIADAMILAELFNKLIAHEVCLVFTSNIEPSRLYEKGLQRQRFFPAIALIEAQAEIIKLDSGFDYRERNSGHAQHYLTPLNEETDAKMRAYFLQYSAGNSLSAGEIEIHHRHIEFIARAPDVIWFNFSKICAVPRSQKDYLAIAADFKTVMISDVVAMKPHETGMVQDFISLIDVMYDHRVRVVISAHVEIDQLYTHGRLVFPFMRTMSRLMEMQGLDWADRREESLM